jgi:hypothetical protein
VWSDSRNEDSEAMAAAMLAWVSITALGGPVVPLV